MLYKKQMERTLGKLENLKNHLASQMFVTVDSLTMGMHRTHEQLFHPPKSGYTPAIKGDTWGSEKEYCWFKGTYTIPEHLSHRQLFLFPLTGFREALLFVDGMPCGIFNKKITNHNFGGHYSIMISPGAAIGDTLEIALEAYAGHNFVGTQPFIEEPRILFDYKIDDFLICTKDELICDLYFNLRTVMELINTTKDDFRQAELMNCLMDCHTILFYAHEYIERALYRERLSQANELLKQALSVSNGENPPMVSIIGHSHMDTAWLWELDETIKKCARTYSNALSLMDQYPEYKFIQSSAYHGEWIRRHYPQLFDKIKAAVATGRYEPNGGVWVECDCNITSGEFMIRQFLWGQQFTREHFNYTSNVFWLPDTFGYSAAIPQIMKGCKVDYFLTTKIDWNDTNQFPFDTFYWKGMDGTTVFSHFNRTHMFPSPDHINQTIYGTDTHQGIAQKGVSNKRLLAFGLGDGGGGPEFEMLELARRCRNTKGMPTAEYNTVGNFMQQLEHEAVNPNTFKGELYLELHRGTLTSVALIKRQNRKAEQAIRDAEICIVRKAIKERLPASDKAIRKQVETTLVNQFHDILPGTSITEVNRRSYQEMALVIEQAKQVALEHIPFSQETANEEIVTAVNTLSFARDHVTLPYKTGKTIVNETVQESTDIDGNKWMKVANTAIPSMAGKVFTYVDGEVNSPSAFTYDGTQVETPFAKVEFDEFGFISSLIDKRNHRQIKGEGYAFNTFLVAEDTPYQWESWDIDADYEEKLAPLATLVHRDVVSNGAVELRIRSTYRILEYSTITQDMVFYSHNPRIDFETKIDWHHKHRLLKVAFDTNIFTNFARQEIQFGYAERPTTRNNPLEAAKFETLNHKYSDLSELNYGVSILNDCKYGISIYEGSMRLTLLKSGTKPDPTGDEGTHYVTYSLLPHMGGFSAKTVTYQAYDLNHPLPVVDGYANLPSLVEITSPNIILETIKPCEKEQPAFIVRLYECEGSLTDSEIIFHLDMMKVEETNMLEETIRDLTADELKNLTFRPFEIKTLKVYYSVQ